jgi:NAD(P)-dependent dehydrogenase (short-subunit alcohol dehydrogenase family)/acyl carrier protein
LKPGGRFLELGKTDLRDPAAVEQRWAGIRYLPVDLSPAFAARAAWVRERMAALLHAIAEGELPALPVTTFDSTEIQEAFRYMARAEHIGRVVICRNAAASFTGTHLITGGMRGIGLKLAEWLAQSGAEELVLIGRRGPDDAAREAISRMQAKGVRVESLQGDIADLIVANAAIGRAGKNLRGIWHSAGVLDNASIAEQSWERMQNVLRPKIDGAWNLHRLSREMPIEQFVLFSSWASIGGSHGQANHCAANAFLDALAHFRRSQGLPALSVNWGAWSETGAASGDDLQRQLARSGMDSMAPDRALEALDRALRLDEPQVAIAAIQWPRYLAQRTNQGSSFFYSEFDSRNQSRREPGIRAAHTDAQCGAKIETPGHASESGAMEAILSLPFSLREAALSRTAAGVVRKALDLHPEEEIDPDAAFSDMGMDSLLAIEVRNHLSVVLQRQLPSTILFDYPTLRTLAGFLQKDTVSKSEPAPAAAAVAPAKVLRKEENHAYGLLDEIEGMSDEEVESSFEWGLRP